MELEASVPKLEDHVNLAVKFPAGSTVSSTCCNKVGISCQLEFSSAEPISKSDYIIICDKASNARYVVLS